MTVNPVPTVNLTITPGTSVCQGENVTFTASPFVPGATYQWYVNGVLQAPTGPFFSTSTLNNADIVQVFATSAAGCTGPASTASAQIQVFPLPSVNVTASANPICAGQTVTFTAFANNAGAMPVYQWFVNGVFVASGITYQTSGLANGDQVTCQVSSSSTGCTGPASAPVVITVAPTPTVSIVSNSPTTLCSGSCVDFTATPTNAGATPTFRWFINGSLVPGFTGANFNYCSMVPGGPYLISAEVVSTSGCASAPSPAIAVNVVQTPTVSIFPNTTTACAGQPITFTATPNISPVNYQWLVNGVAVPGAVGQQYIVTTLANGDVVTCQVTNPSGNCTGPQSTSNPISVSIIGAPVVTIAQVTGADTVCFGSTVSFQATTVSGTVTSYNWKVDGVSAGTNNPIFTTTNLTVGTHDIYVEVAGNQCPGAGPSNVITITVLANPTVSIAATDTSICVGESVTFTPTVVNGGPSPTYQWQVDNGSGYANVGTGSFFTTTTLQNGANVRVLVTGTNGCPTNGAASAPIVMTVFPTPTVASIAVNPATSFCAGQTVTFTASGVNNAGTNPTFEWAVNGVVQAGFTGNTFTSNALNDQDVVTVTVTSGFLCSNPALSSSSVTVTVTASPVVSINVNDADQCSNAQSFDFSATGPVGLTYNWTFGASASQPTVNGAQNVNGITFNAPGSYPVSVVATNAAGCSGTATAQVDVLAAPAPDFFSADTLCVVGGTIDFAYSGNNQGFSGTVNYFWDFLPDGQPATGLGPVVANVTFLTPGDKVIDLRVQFGNGCEESITRTIYADSGFTVNLGPDLVLCQNSPLPTLNAGVNMADPTFGQSVFTWEINGQVVASGTGLNTLPVTTAGIYKVTVQKPSGCVNYDVVNVTLTNLFTVDLGPDRTVCSFNTNPVTLTSGYPGVAHQWTLDGLVIPGSTTDTLLVTGPGVYGVTVNPGGACTGTDFVQIIFTNGTVVELAGGNDTIVYCAADQVLPLDAGNFANGVYQWVYIAPGTSVPQPIAQTSSIIPALTGTYAVTAIAGGCAPGFDTVYVEFVPVIDINLPPTASICPGQGTITLAVDFIPGARYTWRRNGQTVAIGIGQNTFVVTESGNYAVDVLTSGGCTDVASTTVTFAPAPVANFLPDPSGQVVLSVNNTRFTAQDASYPVGTIQSWVWSVINYTTAGDTDTVQVGVGPNLTHNFAAVPDSYYVVLEVTNSPYGCYDISEPLLVIVATPDEDIDLPTAFSPDGDGRNDAYVFEGLGFTTFSFRVYDRWGRIVYEKENNANPVRWKGNDRTQGGAAPEGIYVYVLEGERDDRPGETYRQTGTITLIR
jgi:gliding motility-associated-like protein